MQQPAPFKADMQALQHELPAYLIVANAVAVMINAMGSPVEGVCAIVEFWRTALLQGSSCPYKSWIKLSHFFMLFQPSSASAERAFSLLKRLLERGGMDKARK